MAEGEAQAGAHPWEKSYPENVDWNAPLPKAPMSSAPISISPARNQPPTR